MTDTPVTVTRYGVIPAGAPIADAAHWAPYTEVADANELRRRLDRTFPQDAPHRTIRIEMELTEEGADR